MRFFFKLKLERHTLCNNNNHVIDKSMKLEYINNFLRKKIKTIDSYKLYFSVNDETTFMNMQFFQTKIIPVLREWFEASLIHTFTVNFSTVLVISFPDIKFLPTEYIFSFRVFFPTSNPCKNLHIFTANLNNKVWDKRYDDILLGWYILYDMIIKLTISLMKWQVDN